MQFDPRIFDILRVAPEQRETAAKGLGFAIIGAQFAFVLRRDESVRDEAKRQLARTAKRAEALQQELAQLSRTARHWFEEVAHWREVERDPNAEHRLPNRELGRYEHYRAAVDDIHAIAGDPSHYIEEFAGSPDRRVYSPSPSPFDLMVTVLWIAADAQGWHLTLSPENGTGTLLDILPLIEPHLPEGLIPKAIDMKRLQRLRASARVMARETIPGATKERFYGQKT